MAVVLNWNEQWRKAGMSRSFRSVHDRPPKKYLDKYPYKDCGDAGSHRGHFWGFKSELWCIGHAYDRT